MVNGKQRLELLEVTEQKRKNEKRENEHAIVIREVGERTVRLLNFFSAFVCDTWQLFSKAKEFKMWATVIPDGR